MLLEKYYKVETTREEEQLLRELFVSGDYPPEFSVHAPLFLYSAWAEQKDVCNAEWDRELEQSFLSVPEQQIPNRKWVYSFAAAAVLTLMISLHFSIRHFDIKKKEELRNQQIAYAQTVKTLQFVSFLIDSKIDNSMKLQPFDKVNHKCCDLSSFAEIHLLINHTNQKGTLN